MTQRKFKVGSLYVVRLKDERSVDLLYEMRWWQRWIINSTFYLQTFLKGIVVLVSVLFPPLLFITIPMLKRGNK